MTLARCWRLPCTSTSRTDWSRARGIHHTPSRCCGRGPSGRRRIPCRSVRRCRPPRARCASCRTQERTDCCCHSIASLVPGWQCRAGRCKACTCLREISSCSNLPWLSGTRSPEQSQNDATRCPPRNPSGIHGSFATARHYRRIRRPDMECSGWHQRWLLRCSACGRNHRGILGTPTSPLRPGTDRVGTRYSSCDRRCFAPNVPLRICFSRLASAQSSTLGTRIRVGTACS